MSEPAPGTLLAVFLDGLGADAIGRMPFLAGQPSVRRVRTELGYSVTCHASMYTGLRPDRHGLWFIWQRMPGRSPFRWLRPFRFLDRIDNLPMRVLATKLTRRLVRTSSWFGIPYPVHVPWRRLPELDVAERLLWSDPGYLAPAPTIFDILRDRGTAFEIVGMAHGHAAGLTALEAWEPPASPAPMTYLFAGEIDHASHADGQGSAAVTEVLQRVDRVVERQFTAIRERNPDATLLVWSDHGHHDVERLNPFELLAREGIDLEPHFYVIDTNFLRMWIADPGARQQMADRLNGLGIGHVLTDDELRRYRVAMADGRYGNLIFYLDLPYAFSHTIWGFGRRLASAHGYLPDYPGSDGVLVSNRPLRAGPLELADVAPTVLDALGAPVPAGLDGRSAWTDAAPGSPASARRA